MGAPRGRVWQWTLWAAAASHALACSERERPDRIPDLSGEDARRILSGSFASPAIDAGPGVLEPGGSDGSRCSSDGGAAPCEGDMASGSGTGVLDPTGAMGPVTSQQTYEATCDGSAVQWGFFTYFATTPMDSSVGFRLRTAPTEAELPMAEYVPLSTASAALGTERCSFSGPSPCPIDLFVVLGGAPLAHHPVSELEVMLNPSSDGSMPEVERWQLTFSCTFNQ